MRSFEEDFRYATTTCFCILTICLVWVIPGTGTLQAQRISYQDLLKRNDKPQIYLDHFLLHSPGNDKVNFVTTFRIDYNLLRFKKLSSQVRSNANKSNKPAFQSTATLNFELFTSESQSNIEKIKKADYQALAPVVRKIWKNTVFADTYEQTQSNKHHLSGYFSTEVQPGIYRYLIQINRGGDTDQSITRSRVANIQKTGTDHHLPFYYVDSLHPSQKPREASIANFGKNVNYGKDFHLLFQLPENTGQTFRLTIYRVKINEKDTMRQQNVYSRELSESDILPSATPSLFKDSTSLKFSIDYDGNKETRYGLLKIPNSRFENGKFQIVLKNSDSDKVLNRDYFQSRWINMPISLLNIDVSIRMLRFIVEEKKLNQIQNGSREEKIGKFKKFWNERDPTPETSYNELMAEYYRRIDHAYEKFSSINQPGFETDMGKIYIRRGPPESVKRKFPSGQRAVEVWNYPNKTYIFRATTGFGDFELVSEN